MAVAAAVAVAVPAVLTAMTPAPSFAAAASPEVSASASPRELTYGSSLSVSGRVSQAGQGVAGSAVELQSDPYPYRGWAPLARTSSAADGSFAFTGLEPDRDARLRVILEAGPAAPGASSPSASQTMTILLSPSAAIDARSQGPGEARLSIRLAHTLQSSARPVSAQWFVAPRGSHVFRLAAVTSTRELSPGLTYASATIDPPARRFEYRICLAPGWGRAMQPSRPRLACPRRRAGAFVYGGEGRGIPEAPYPSRAAIAAAVRYLDGRAGRTSFAVVNSVGELGGSHLREHFETASVVKVMMLVAFLQMRSVQHRDLDEADSSLLYPMIHISDNEAASAVYGLVGEPALARVARESGMSDYAPGVGWWAYTQTSAADQARFFFALPHLIPPRFYAYARGLLSGIEPSQSWGVPPVARPQWQVFFKTGALPEEGLFNEVARLERPGLAFTIAVFTDGDPSKSYGEQTIEGVATALLAHSP